MKTRFANSATRHLSRFMVVAILLFATPLAIGLARAAADDSANSGEDAAVKQVVAGFSDGWNTARCACDVRIACR